MNMSRKMKRLTATVPTQGDSRGRSVPRHAACSSCEGLEEGYAGRVPWRRRPWTDVCFCTQRESKSSFARIARESECLFVYFSPFSVSHVRLEANRCVTALWRPKQN